MSVNKNNPHDKVCPKNTHLHIPNQYGDRFIPRRYTKMNECQRYFATLQTKSLHFSLDIIQLRDVTSYWRLHYLEVILNDTFNVHDQDRRVFALSDALIKCNRNVNCLDGKLLEKNEPNKSNKHHYDWPCNPRSQPYAFIQSSHDLPGSQFFADSVIAWSPNGKIIASFGKDLVIWLPGSDETFVIGIDYVQAVAFDKTGDYMIVARNLRATKLELWSLEKNTRIGCEVPYCDDITCIEWNHLDNCVVFGCIDTCLYIINSADLKSLHIVPTEHECKFKILKFSPKFHYLASVDESGCIIIWRYMFKKLIHFRKLPFFMSVFIDWNPFADDELVIAESTRVRICILKVNAIKAMAYYYRKDKIFSIDGISFNKVSGEMVVACTVKNAIDGCHSHEVLVLASLNRVVDIIRHHEELIRVLLWSPDGKQLATICDDESLVIWNFLPNNKCYKNSKTNFNVKTNKNKCNVDVFNYCTGLQIR